MLLSARPPLACRRLSADTVISCTFSSPAAAAAACIYSYLPSSLLRLTRLNSLACNLTHSMPACNRWWRYVWGIILLSCVVVVVEEWFLSWGLAGWGLPFANEPYSAWLIFSQNSYVFGGRQTSRNFTRPPSIILLLRETCQVTWQPHLSRAHSCILIKYKPFCRFDKHLNIIWISFSFLNGSEWEREGGRYVL